MISSEQEFLAFMNVNNLVFQRIEHPAVFTCAEAESYRPKLPAVSTKNLFLCDKKKRHFFLVVTSCEKTVRLDDLKELLGVSHLRFGSETDLMRLLGVGRGSVTMMGLINDAEHVVELWGGKEIWKGEHFLSHPLVNTATLILPKTELERFFELTGHDPHLFSQKEGK